MEKKPKTVDIFNTIMMNFTDPDALEFFNKAFDEETKKPKFCPRCNYGVGQDGFCPCHAPEKEKKNDKTNKD